MNGYFALTVDFLCEPRVLDIYFDSAPAERNYAGYFYVTQVLFNGVDLTPALTEDDLKVIAEDVQHEIEYRKRTKEFA